MLNSLTDSSTKTRDEHPGQSSHPAQTKSPEKSISIAADWRSGTMENQDSDSEVIVSVDSESQAESESSSMSGTSSTSSTSEQQTASSAAKKMRSSDAEDDPIEENLTQQRQHPSKFCLTGVGTSLGFSAAVAGFAATTFLYDLMTRFPEKSTTETGVGFGASIVIALGGTITCSTSMVFMIRELCKTKPG